MLEFQRLGLVRPGKDPGSLKIRGLLCLENRVGVYEIPINLHSEARPAGQVNVPFIVNLYVFIQAIIKRLLWG